MSSLVKFLQKPCVSRKFNVQALVKCFHRGDNHFQTSSKGYARDSSHDQSQILGDHLTKTLTGNLVALTTLDLGKMFTSCSDLTRKDKFQQLNRNETCYLKSGLQHGILSHSFTCLMIKGYFPMDTPVFCCQCFPWIHLLNDKGIL